jgi:hypothetical protein
LDFSLVREDADAVDAADALRDRPLNNRLVLDSVGPSPYATGGSEVVELKVGGEMISWVLVSERMNKNTGASSCAGTLVSATLSFFLSKSLIGIVANL